MTRRILVIGGLAAGPSAASKAARILPDAEVVLFEQGDAVSYGICEIPYYISGEVAPEGLISYTPEGLRTKKRVDARVLHRVEEIQLQRRSLAVRNLRTGAVEEEGYDRLIIATGSRPRSLGLDGERLRNVFRVKTLDEGHALRKYIDEAKPRTAVIIGGGYIGMEMCDVLRALGLDVTLIHNHSLPMKGLERETQEKVREELERHGVTFMGQAITEGFVTGKDQRVTHVVTGQGTCEADLVIVAIGVQPDTALAKKAGLRLGTCSGILTDQRQQTSADNVFAAGDCCEVKSLVTGKQVYLPLATVASKAGWTAGTNAAGGNTVFRGAIRAIAVRVFGLEVANVGASAEEARAAGLDPVTESITAWSRVAVMPGARQVTVTAIADRSTRRLLGANVFGPEGAVLRANTLAVAIQQKATVDDMQQWDLAYSPPFTPLWDPLIVAANALRKKL
jgi:NADPH-dependent 2,4-dienoyl-CoA reductase/sulfur reductase-like enzyme